MANGTDVPLSPNNPLFFVMPVVSSVGTIANFTILVVFWLKSRPITHPWHRWRRKANGQLRSPGADLTEEESKENSSEVTICMLTLSDLALCVFLIPVILLNERGIYFPGFCAIYIGIIAFFPQFSSFLMVVVAIERFVYVSQPFVPQLTRRQLLCMEAVLALVVLIYSCSLMPFMNHHGICQLTRGAGVLLRRMNKFLLGSSVGLVVLFYSLIYFTVLRYRAKQQLLSSLANNIRIALMQFTLAFCFFAIYTISMWQTSLDEFIPLLIYMYCFMPIVNPFIYLTFNKRLRRDVAILLSLAPCMRCICRKSMPKEMELPLPRRQARRMPLNGAVEDQPMTAPELIC